MNLNLDLENNLNLKNEQNNFLESSLGKVINIGLDMGLKAILPDFLENEIINIKDAILENGFKEGIKQAVSSGINLGKSAMGIITGNFENVTQIQTAVKKGGIIDTVSDLLSKAVDLAKNKGLINYNTSNLIKSGKNAILEQISENIEEELTNQIGSIEKLEKYCNNWQEYFNNKDFEGMEKEYKKIEKQVENIIPLEKTINNTRTIENLHKLIKNNGKNFDLSEEEIELAKRL